MGRWYPLLYPLSKMGRVSPSPFDYGVYGGVLRSQRGPGKTPAEKIGAFYFVMERKIPSIYW